MALFFVMFKLKKKVEGSSMIYVLYVLFVTSEFIVLCYIGILAFPYVFLAEIVGVALSFLFCGIYASVKREDYGIKAARIISIGSFAGTLVLFGLFTDILQVILIVILVVNSNSKSKFQKQIL